MRDLDRPTSVWSHLPAVLAAAPPTDRVELKVVLEADTNSAALARAAAVIPGVQRRCVLLLDTAEGDLARAGFVLRVREGAGSADAAVKWRSVSADPHTARRLHAAHPHLRTDLDVLPGRAHWSAKVMRRIPRRDARRVVSGDLVARALLSREQRSLLRAGTPRATLRHLQAVCSAEITRSRLTRLPRGAYVDVEVWRCGDGNEIIEISTRCHPGQATRSAEELCVLLEDVGVHPAADQALKTELALLHSGRRVDQARPPRLVAG